MLIRRAAVVHPVAVYFSSNESPALAAKLRPVRLLVEPAAFARVAAVCLLVLLQYEPDAFVDGFATITNQTLQTTVVFRP